MDWLTFTSKIFDAVAWPMASIALVLILRKQIELLVPTLKRLKAGPLEAEFDREVKELVKLTNSAKAATNSVEVGTASRDSTPKEFLIQLAALNPRSAVLEAWLGVEAAARAALDGYKGLKFEKGPPSSEQLSGVLESLELIREGLVDTFDELYRLRNEAAHSVDLSPTWESARAYIDSALFMQNWLESWRKAK